MPFIQKKPTKLFDARKQRMEERGKLYATTRWRKLRLAYLQTFPLCQLCEAAGRVTPGADVHHIHSPFVEGESYMYEWENLLTLCKDCHGALHGGDEEKKEQTLKIYEERKRH